MSVPGPGPCATIGTVVSARRTPVALPVIVVGLAVAAAFGSGATGTAGPRTESGTFATVPPDTDPDGGPAGSDVEASADAVEDPSGATSVTAPTDDTVPDDEPVVTALGPGILPGIDWPVFDDLIAPPLIDQGALAVSIAVSKDGRLVHEAAYGIADPATGEPVDASSRFRIASNSKLITSTVALQLVEEGLLSLDEPVLAPLAEQLSVGFADQRMADVTLRQLLSHSSGFADFREEFFRGRAVGCEDATIAAFSNPLSGTPGSTVNYSNMNFCIVGLLIELATGDGYEAAVYDHLLTPLGITDMRVTGNGDVRPGDVVHPGDPGRNFMEVLGGAGSWIASASDLLAIVDSLDTSRPGWHPISAEMAAEMQGRSERAEPSRSHGFGLGLLLFGDSWGHTGTLQNAHSMVLHRPDGFSFAILVSGSAPSESNDLRHYADRALQAIGVPLLSLVSPVPVTATSVEPVAATTVEPVAATTVEHSPTTTTIDP